MKKLLAIVVLGLLWSGSANAIKDRDLSSLYNDCSNGGYGHKYCKCNVEVVDKKLTQYQYNNLLKQSWKFSDWMLENVHPVCKKYLKN